MARLNSATQFPWQRGFTLLEVLVAMALIGIGFSSAFVAISGTNRLTEKSAGYENAMTLARSKLDEVLSTPHYLLTEDEEEMRYAGYLFGYRIKVRPVDLPLPEGIEKSALPFLLENVTIDVFWGPSGSQQSYSLSTMHFSMKEGTSNPGVAPSMSQSGNQGRVPP